MFTFWGRNNYIWYIFAVANIQPSQVVGNENSPIVYSAKHDGLYLYVSRMLRSIWQLPCVDKNFCSKVGPQDCSLLLSDLRSLRRFLEDHSVHDISCRLQRI